MQQVFGSMLRPAGSESDFSWTPSLDHLLRILAGIGFDKAGCCSSSGACFAQQDPKATCHGLLPRPVFANTGWLWFRPSRLLQLFGGMLRPTRSASDFSQALSLTSFLRILAGISFEQTGCCEKAVGSSSSSGACFARLVRKWFLLGLC